MRDAFFLQVFERAKANPNIVVLTSDFSAPSFDRFRTELPGQFINTGISEQNTILVAAGLALSGKTVFATSIAPFITMRCFEQTRLYAADMNLNIKIVAIGAGFSYNTAGPTHHSVEDIALMRTLPNMRILMPCCNSQVAAFADNCVDKSGPAYVRLDRMTLDEQYDGVFAPKTDPGFSVLRPVAPITLAATGYMVHTALKAAADLQTKGVSAGVLDIYRLPLDEAAFSAALTDARQLITIEEHVKAGGLGAAICEILNDNNHPLPVKRFALDFSQGFHHGYGTRDHMHDVCGIGVKQIQEYLEESITDER
jgi:transketolase